MTNKHTPGPWQVGGNHGENANMVFCSGESSVAQVYGMPMHASISEIPSKYAEGLANARLIAAAPDLLAALELLIAAHAADETGNICTSDVEAAMYESRAALAKARGEA